MTPWAGMRVTSAQVDPYRREWEAANRRALDDEGPLLAVLGDSAAQGVGAASPFDGWVGQLRRRLDTIDGHGWRVLNLSVSGARAHTVLDEQLPRLWRVGQPVDLVVCAVGGNDMYRSTAAQVRDRFTRLLRALPAPGTWHDHQRTVVTTLPQGLGRRRAGIANELVRTLGPRRGLEVADLWATTGPPWQGKYAEDMFHPNERGYADWVEAILGAIRPSHGSLGGDLPVALRRRPPAQVLQGELADEERLHDGGQ